MHCESPVCSLADSSWFESYSLVGRRRNIMQPKKPRLIKLAVITAFFVLAFGYLFSKQVAYADPLTQVAQTKKPLAATTQHEHGTEPAQPPARTPPQPQEHPHDMQPATEKPGEMKHDVPA